MNTKKYGKIWSERIKKLMVKNKWTVKKLSQKTKISESSIRAFLNYGYLPTIKTALRLSKVFKKSIDYLVGLKNK